VDAVRTGDPEFAAAAMRVHLAMVAAAVERELAKMAPRIGVVPPSR